nr:MAG TPA: hypothetical protein [Siphoviridae sp. ctuHV12]DAM77138.1 MAG TPA: hypothetical protein [Caudoviricetes sp.]
MHFQYVVLFCLLCYNIFRLGPLTVLVKILNRKECRRWK